jgi:glutamate racemase
LIEQTVAAAGKAVGVIDTGAAVARQLQRLLTHHAVAAHPAHRSASVTACTTGTDNALAMAFSSLLGMHPVIDEVNVISTA